MNATADPRFAVPPCTRPFYPSWPHRIAFFLLGVAAAKVRFLTGPWRRYWRRTAPTRNCIVVLEPYGMGDIVALQPLVRAWCEAGREVVVGARAEWHPLLVPHPKLVCIDLRPAWASTDETRKHRGWWCGPDGFLELAKTLAPLAHGARGVDVRGDVRSVLLLYLAGCGRVETLTRYFVANDCRVFPLAAHRLPVDRTVERWRLNAVFARRDGLTLSPPSVAHLRKADSGTVCPNPPSLQAPMPHPVQEQTAKSSEGTPDLRIGLVPLTPWAGKRWAPESWHEVVQHLRQRGCSPVVLCGPNEKAEALQAIGDPDQNLALPVNEACDVRAWVEALSRCTAVVSVNTGAVHLAAALDLPLVVLEGSSRLPLWAPYSNNARVIHHQDLPGGDPCHQAGEKAITRSRKTMSLVTVAEVVQELVAILK